jgi:hypothetical protein
MESRKNRTALKDQDSLGSFDESEGEDAFLAKPLLLGHRIVRRIMSAFSFVAYRYPIVVSEYRLYQEAFGREYIYYYCPRCDITLNREFQFFCDRCGQRLNWKHIDKARLRQRTDKFN